jgi:hypothetical protein
MTRLLVFVSLAIPGLLQAQGNRIVRVKAGDDVAQAYSPNGFYRLPAFSDATVYFSGGAQNKGTLLNYNILSGSLQFISPKGDTLDMAGTNSIDSVVFPNLVYLYKDGFLEVAGHADSLLLLKKIQLKTQVESVGAYGMPNTTASITNIRSFSNANGVYNLILNQDLVITESVTWFVSNKGSTPVKMSKDNFLKLLSGPQLEKANNYLKQNRTNFDRENDLKKLLAALVS